MTYKTFIEFINFEIKDKLISFEIQDKFLVLRSKPIFLDFTVVKRLLCYLSFYRTGNAPK
ncbi:hypothetical protein MHTCC0001_28940 [Flavobacteriaceae bacterium MHTCC 0001]